MDSQPLIPNSAGVASMSETSDLRTLKQTRTSIQGRITRLGNFIASLEPPTDVCLDELQTRLEYLNRCYDEFLHTQSQIETLQDDADEAELQRASVEDYFFSTASAYKKCIRDFTSINSPPLISQPNSEIGTNTANLVSSNSNPTGTQIQNTIGGLEIKLPPVSLPHFDGRIEEYEAFKELFQAIIETSPLLNDTTRFLYLRSALRGTAANVIRSLPATAQHYKTAWSLLDQRYSARATTIHKLNCELLNLPNLQNEHPGNLRKFLDDVTRILRTLSAYSTIKENGDAIFVSIIIQKLDPESKKLFQMSLSNADYVATIDDIQTFLNKRIQILESLVQQKTETRRNVTSLPSTLNQVQGSNRAPLRTMTRQRQGIFNNKPSGSNKPLAKVNSQTPLLSHLCLLCKGHTHFLARCPAYLELSIDDRIKCVSSNKACFNCLSPLHSQKECPSSFSCRECSRKHHTTIHRYPIERKEEEPTPSTSNSNSAVALFNQQIETSQILLGTAVIFMHDVDGNPIRARILMDAGSQANIVTRDFAEKLRLPIISSQVNISGVGKFKTSAAQRIFSKFSSTDFRFSAASEFIVLPVITTLLPAQKIDISQWKLPSRISLADENFNIPSPIDVLLGADLFFKLLSNQKIPGNSERPTLIKTRLGWILAGELPKKFRPKSVTIHLSLSEQLEKFWQLEHCKPAETHTAEEIECEDHFKKTHTRNSEGRYIVRLPFKKDPTTLGHSRSQARRRWLSVESRLAKDDTLRESYHSFMKQYLELGHMSCVGPEHEVPDELGNYFLPHHPVFKAQSTSTKVRIVFDASMKTSSGTSLNQILMCGPTVQSELFDILLRFRSHRYVIVGDVKQMYRQVLVAPQDRAHQLIFWRELPTARLCVYKLNTVTYGTTPAPFLSTRSLQQLAFDERTDFPHAAVAVLEDVYVDDLLTGYDTLDGALSLQKELIALLARGGFPLRKFASNHPALLEDIPESDRETLFALKMTSEDAMKTLGLIWIPSSDSFIYDASNITRAPSTTKRQILSQIASLFDPLGLLGALVSGAKIFMQQLWAEKYDWDDKLPDTITEKWKTFMRSLSSLSDIKIPRFASYPLATQYQLHGFCDASESAYGCTIYLRTRKTETSHSVTLLCSKSRVAPLKQLTIPRLELCATLLLTRLLATVTRAMKLVQVPTVCWTDSQISLAWISSPPTNWKNFVANRVSEIRDYETTWRHVPSEFNPADLISRGATVAQLKDSQLWWEGPEFLHEDNSPLLSAPIPDYQGETPEKKRTKNIVLATVNNFHDMFSRYSALHKLINITAWMLRFANKSRRSDIRSSKGLDPVEHQTALSCLIRIAQAETFTQELTSLTAKGHVSRKSKLRQLIPFIDEHGLLRVGGRLKNSSLTSDRKHPIILAPGHPLTNLIITQAHLQCLHGGPQLVLTIIRHKFWIINGKNVIRRILHNCVTCFKLKPVNQTPMMGQLPALRTTPSRAFFNTGVDFTGPFMLKAPTRSNIKLKHYVAVFICMATRSIHLELVGSLTAENFIAVLKCFVSRRGLCQSISCDNATNFVGARNSLKEVYQLLKKENSSIAHYLAKQHIKWNFITPLTPHCGGMWEAGVKSFKHHLRRVAGLAFLTYEEFLTVICAIEACLNSRPLTALSSDPSDLEALTPGHFLIGAPLLAVPEVNHIEQPISRLTRWHRTQAITQHFWKRWSVEYVASLTPLSKWSEETIPLAVDKLVVIRDDHLPPLQWKLGRIEATHPGKDGITRVVTVKTASGTVTRHACRIYQLPIESTPT